MTTLDELHDQLEQLAASEGGRPAAELFERASRVRRSHQRRGAALAIAAVIAVIAGVGGVLVLRDRGDAIVTTPRPQPAGGVLPKLALAPGQHVVAVAFGKVWVASAVHDDPPTTGVSAYDATTGRRMGTVRTSSGSDLVGSVSTVRMTDSYLWVRTSMSGSTTAHSTANVIYQVDPLTMNAIPNRHLVDDGPLGASRDRIVASDSTHLEIVREDGVELAIPELSSVIGLSAGGSTPVARLDALHIDEHGLWVATTNPVMVQRLDATTAAPIGMANRTWPAVDRETKATHPRWWFAPDAGSMDQPLRARLSIYGMRLDTDADAEPLALVLPPSTEMIDQIDDHRILVRSDRYGIFDTTTGETAPAPGSPTAADLHVLFIDGRPYLSGSVTDGLSTTAEFTPLAPSVAPKAGSSAGRGKTGLIGGTLEEVGGPSPDAARRVAGQIWITPKGGDPSRAEMYQIASSGRFRIPTAPGTYAVRGTTSAAPQIGCVSPDIVVSDGQESEAQVVCSVR